MCLSKVSATHSAPSELIVDGWKAFNGATPNLKFAHMGGAVTLDTWILASSLQPPVNIKASDGKTYAAGFHAYTEGTSMHAHARTRVYLRRITSEGLQDGEKAVIAAEMYVPSQSDAWPPLSATPPSAAPAQKRTGKNLLSRLRQKPGGKL